VVGAPFLGHLRGAAPAPYVGNVVGTEDVPAVAAGASSKSCRSPVPSGAAGTLAATWRASSAGTFSPSMTRAPRLRS